MYGNPFCQGLDDLTSGKTLNDLGHHFTDEKLLYKGVK